ncbi:MAG: histidinol-phosphate transaminase [Velocimicrobium sp.]
MLKPKEQFHGSDLEKIEQFYAIKKEEITSFSANVNPLGISFQLKETLASHIDAITSYPDREYTSLRTSIASYVGVNIDRILVGNGSTELISLFIQFIHPKDALIVSPTYSEYEREIALEEGHCHYFELKEIEDFTFNLGRFSNELLPQTDLVIICNPNNPTSSHITSRDMASILKLCKQNNTFVLVDETYVEFTKDINDITAIPLTNQYDNLIVLRGISKFFAAPGLRLGYAICGNQELLTNVNEKKNPWTINSLASIAGEIMFKDTNYIKDTKELIFEERKRVCTILKESKTFKVYEPSANFVLLRILRKHLTASDVFDSCIQKGLMIRDCSTFPFLDSTYIRFCFMNREKNDELLEVLMNL